MIYNYYIISHNCRSNTLIQIMNKLGLRNGNRKNRNWTCTTAQLHQPYHYSQPSGVFWKSKNMQYWVLHSYLSSLYSDWLWYNIYCKINSQDVLKQNGLLSNALWPDEGFYQLANEIQLLRPEKFSNIFLDIVVSTWKIP